MINIGQQAQEVAANIARYQKQYANHSPITLVAVSKGQSTEKILGLYACGYTHLGENYLQEALAKISTLSDKAITWHFIGRLQSNKLRDIAAHFDWVQTLTREKEANLLSQYRESTQSPLNICIQIDLNDNPQRNGIKPQDIPKLAAHIASLPHLALRGLMVLPPPGLSFEAARKYFGQAKAIFDNLIALGYPLDTLSMGMTHDFEAAIAEGATLLRIGTGIFGERHGAI